MMLLIMMRLLRSCIVIGIDDDDGAVVVRGADDLGMEGYLWSRATKRMEVGWGVEG